MANKIPSAERRDAVREKKKFDTAKETIEASKLQNELDKYLIVPANEAILLGHNPISQYSNWAVFDKYNKLVGWFLNREGIQKTLEAKIIRESKVSNKKCVAKKSLDKPQKIL